MASLFFCFSCLFSFKIARNRGLILKKMRKMKEKGEGEGRWRGFKWVAWFETIWLKIELLRGIKLPIKGSIIRRSTLFCYISQFILDHLRKTQSSRCRLPRKRLQPLLFLWKMLLFMKKRTKFCMKYGITL